YNKFELIIIDDGSTDKSVEKVKVIKDPRLKLIQQSNKGVSAARNQGIRSSMYEYIAFLDADDKWEPDFLKTIYTLIQKYQHAAMFATNYTFVRENGSIEEPKLNSNLPENTFAII